MVIFHCTVLNWSPTVRVWRSICQDRFSWRNWLIKAIDPNITVMQRFCIMNCLVTIIAQQCSGTTVTTSNNSTVFFAHRANNLNVRSCTAFQNSSKYGRSTVFPNSLHRLHSFCPDRLDIRTGLDLFSQTFAICYTGSQIFYNKCIDLLILHIKKVDSLYTNHPDFYSCKSGFSIINEARNSSSCNTMQVANFDNKNT
jgi:hypothetical protein